MVPEDLQEEAALSASDPAVEEPAPTTAEVAEGTSDVVAATASLSSWADLSEEAPVPFSEPDDLIDLGVDPEGTTSPSREGAAFGAPLDESLEEDLQQFDELAVPSTEVKDKEHVTAEDILRELEDPAPGVEDTDPSGLEAEPADLDNHPNAAEFSESVEPKEEEADFEEVLVEEVPVDPAASEPSAIASTDPVPEEEDSVPPPPTLPFLAPVRAAEGTPTTGHV